MKNRFIICIGFILCLLLSSCVCSLPSTPGEPDTVLPASLSLRGDIKISLVFQKIHLRALFHVLANTLDLNMVVADNIDESVSINLNDVTWNDAFRFILQTNNLTYRIYNNILYISKAVDIVAKDKLQQELNVIMENVAPLATEFYKVNYANVSELCNLINTNYSCLCSTNGKISFDENTNTIIILELRSRISAIKKILQKLDVPRKQVIIETFIVKTSLDLKDELGFKYTGNTNNPANGSFSFNLGINEPVNTAKFKLNKLAKGLLLDLELQALEKEQKLFILASPKLLTLDRKVAIIEAGKEIPYVTKSRSGADPQVIFKKAVLRLEVIPIITPKDEIILDLKINKDQPGVQVPGIAQAPIDTTQLSTKVVVKSGDTIVLGGIFSEKEVETISKLPILGDLPLLKYIFSSKQKTVDKSEIIIFVTPRIVQ